MWGMAASIYQQVTDRIVRYIEENQALPWRKPWHARVPANALTGREYRGINRVLLSMAPYSDHRWLTYRAAQELGGNVLKGERGTSVVFWHFDDDEDSVSRRVLCRTYTLFNVEQCDGLKMGCVESKVQEPNSFETLNALKELLDRYPNPPQFRSHASEAFYEPSTDTICIPPMNEFESVEMYASVLLHETVHSTGHESRLARPGVLSVQPGTHLYQQEELVAEMGAAMLCQEIGIDTTWQLSASYLHGWLNAFRSSTSLLLKASAESQRACDLLLGRESASEDQGPTSERELALA